MCGCRFSKEPVLYTKRACFTLQKGLFCHAKQALLHDEKLRLTPRFYFVRQGKAPRVPNLRECLCPRFPRQ